MFPRATSTIDPFRSGTCGRGEAAEPDPSTRIPAARRRRGLSQASRSDTRSMWVATRSGRDRGRGSRPARPFRGRCRAVAVDPDGPRRRCRHHGAAASTTPMRSVSATLYEDGPLHAPSRARSRPARRRPRAAPQLAPGSPRRSRRSPLTVPARRRPRKNGTPRLRAWSARAPSLVPVRARADLRAALLDPRDLRSRSRARDEDAGLRPSRAPPRRRGAVG
jgi:hypothetical protein